jgi:hypothetical protein
MLSRRPQRAALPLFTSASVAASAPAPAGNYALLSRCRSGITQPPQAPGLTLRQQRSSAGAKVRTDARRPATHAFDGHKDHRQRPSDQALFPTQGPRLGMRFVWTIVGRTRTA